MPLLDTVTIGMFFGNRQKEIIISSTNKGIANFVKIFSNGGLWRHCKLYNVKNL